MEAEVEVEVEANVLTAVARFLGDIVDSLKTPDSSFVDGFTSLARA